MSAARASRHHARTLAPVIDFKRLREATERLLEIEGELEAITEAFPDLYFWVDPDGTVRHVKAGRGSEAYIDDASPEARVGKTVRELLPPDVASQHLVAIHQALETDSAVSIEYTVTVRGQRRHREARLVPLGGKESGERQVLVVVRDTTERNEAEAATRALAEVSREMAKSLDFARASQTVVTSVLRLFRVRRSALFRFEPATRTVVCAAAAGEGAVEQWQDRRFRLDEGVEARFQLLSGPVVTPDAAPESEIALPHGLVRRLREEGLRSVAVAPLVAYGSMLGVLVLADAEGRVFTEADAPLLAAFADEAAVGLENARLYAEATASRRQVEALARVATSLTESLDVKVVTERIIQSGMSLFNAVGATIRLRQPDGSLVSVAGAGMLTPELPEGHVMPPGVGTMGRAVAEGRPVWTSDILRDTDIVLTEEIRRVFVARGSRASLAVPLRAKGQMIGAFVVAHERGHLYGDEEVRLAQLLADHAAVALENARSYAGASRQRQEAETLARVAASLTETLEVNTVAQSIAKSALDIFSAKGATIRLLRPDGSLATMARAGGVLGRFAWSNVLPPEVGIMGRAVAENRPVWSSDVVADPKVLLTEEMRGAFAAEGGRASLSVPLRAKGRVIGAFTVSHDRGHVFSDDEVQLAQSLADHAALALESARLYQEASQRREGAEKLAEVERLISRSLDAQVVGQAVVESVRSLLDVTVTAVHRLEPETGDLVTMAAAGEVGPAFGVGTVLPRGRGASGLAVCERRAVTSPNILEDPGITLTPDLRVRLEGSGFRAVLVVPLIAGDQVLGALGIGGPVGREFTDIEIELVTAFASHSAMAFQNAQLYEEAKRRRVVAEKLAEVVGLLSRTLDPAEVGQRIVENLAAFLNAGACVLTRLDRESDTLKPEAVFGDDERRFRSRAALPTWTGVSGLAVRERRPVTTPDVLADPRIVLTPEWRAHVTSVRHRAVLAVPLLGSEGVIGTLAVAGLKGREFTPEEIELAETFAGYAAFAVENSRLHQEVVRTRDFFESMAQHTPEPVITTDRRGRILYVNRRLQQLLGYGASEIIGRPVREYVRSGEAEVQAVGRRLTAEGRIPEYRTAVRARDGDWVEVSASLSLICDAHDAVAGVLAILREQPPSVDGELRTR